MNVDGYGRFHVTIYSCAARVQLCGQCTALEDGGEGLMVDGVGVRRPRDGRRFSIA